MESVPFLPLFLPAERNWHREAILACVSKTGEGEAFTGGGMLFPPRTPYFWR